MKRTLLFLLALIAVGCADAGRSAFLVWDLFRESGLHRVTFSRDDALIAEVRAEW